MATSSPSSPLRYPGGKQSLSPFVRALIRANDMYGCVYAEPYAGGAGLALRLLMDDVVSRVLLNDKCPMICSFWRSLFWQTDELLQLVDKNPVTMETWRRTREITRRPKEFSEVEVAFALFFQNRTNFSGVIDGGVIGGKKQVGKYKLDARYPKDRLLKLMETLSMLRDRVSIFHLDAISFMHAHVLPWGRTCLTYCDPPYFEKGQALYMNSYLPEDHVKVADFLHEHASDMRWMVSYDNAPQIIALYKEDSLYSFDLPYSAHRVRRGKELLALSSDVNLPQGVELVLKLSPVTFDSISSSVV